VPNASAVVDAAMAILRSASVGDTDDEDDNDDDGAKV
jgi:hypothetical protein